MLSISPEQLQNLKGQITLDLFLDARKELSESLTTETSYLQAMDQTQFESLYTNIAIQSVMHQFTKVSSLKKILINRLHYGEGVFESPHLGKVLGSPYLCESAKVWAMGIFAEKQIDHNQNCGATVHTNTADIAGNQPTGLTAELGHSPYDTLAEYSAEQRAADIQILERRIPQYPANHAIVKQRLLHHQGYYLAIIAQVLSEQTTAKEQSQQLQSWQGKDFDLAQGCPVSIYNQGLNKQLSFISDPKQSELSIRLNNIGEHLTITVPADSITAYSNVLIALVTGYCQSLQTTEQIKNISLVPETYTKQAESQEQNQEQSRPENTSQPENLTNPSQPEAQHG